MGASASSSLRSNQIRMSNGTRQPHHLHGGAAGPPRTPSSVAGAASGHDETALRVRDASLTWQLGRLVRGRLPQDVEVVWAFLFAVCMDQQQLEALWDHKTPSALVGWSFAPPRRRLLQRDAAASDAWTGDARRSERGAARRDGARRGGAGRDPPPLRTSRCLAFRVLWQDNGRPHRTLELTPPSGLRGARHPPDRHRRVGSRAILGGLTHEYMLDAA